MSIATESATQQDATLVVRPLQPTIGAEISGVDLRYPLGDALRDQVRVAILDYKVVFFRDQDGSSEAAAAASMAARVSIGRFVTAAEVADVVAFLASPRSVAINGDAIAAGGGTPGAIHY
jgi:alpha-ketoglutarate-dependent taurine dioxygenase